MLKESNWAQENFQELKKYGVKKVMFLQFLKEITDNEAVQEEVNFRKGTYLRPVKAFVLTIFFKVCERLIIRGKIKITANDILKEYNDWFGIKVNFN